MIKYFFSLIKILQTALLVITGAAGFISLSGRDFQPQVLAALIASLFLSISGCTVLNMVYDRDIDLKMSRTANRPIPNGYVSPASGIFLGSLLILTGVAWAFTAQILYGWIVTAGVIFDVVIYTMWLRRRTPFSVLLGGLSGGMPILAGRALASGRIDLPGLVLSAAVLVWIPIHTLTLHLKYQQDFDDAGIPTFSGYYGQKAARILISISAGLSALVMVVAIWMIHLGSLFLIILILLGLGLLIIMIISFFKNKLLHSKLLFRSASLFMLIAMTLIIMGKLAG